MLVRQVGHVTIDIICLIVEKDYQAVCTTYLGSLYCRSRCSSYLPGSPVTGYQVQKKNTKDIDFADLRFSDYEIFGISSVSYSPESDRDLEFFGV